MIRSHFLHNLIAHPLMALLHAIGAERAGDWVHNELIIEPDGGTEDRP